MPRGPQVVASVDYAFWGRLDEWTLNESAALLAGLDPKTIGDQPANKEFDQIRELIDRAVTMGDLLNHTRPTAVLSWAKLKRVTISPKLLKAVGHFGGTVEDFRHNVRELQKEINSLQEDLARLEATAKTSAEETRPLTIPERRVVKTIILTLAVYGRDYRPGGPIAPQIARDAERLGLTIDDGSIRSWLNEAAQLVPDEVWAALPKPKSAKK
ncbi:MAG: hypothetical protein WAW96_18290 [Alphaproteobacteria bacterium]